MVRTILVAALAVVATSEAFAGDVYDFKIGGQSIHIEQPRNCNSPSCATISIPGIYESGPKHKRARDTDDTQASPAKDAEPKTAATTPLPAPAAPNAASPSVAAPSAETSLEPANGTASRPASAPSAGLAPPVVAAATPTTVPATQPVATISPVGLWLTEEKEGKVRIEACGANLCGYSVDARTNANGDKVLVNMKPVKDKWSGKIHDPKSGSSYDSTIAMNGADRLRVQGCAFGGMFCGGQTWTRVN